MSIDLKERTEGICDPLEEKPIPFTRYHFVVSYKDKEFVFYVYQYAKTKNWFVHYCPFDECLRQVRWSKTLWNAFKKQVGVVNTLGINDGYIRRFMIPEEVVEEMEERMRDI